MSSVKLLPHQMDVLQRTQSMSKVAYYLDMRNRTWENLPRVRESNIIR